MDNRTIFCHDNLEILRGINSECIDLLYLDPPFNKNKKFVAPTGSAAAGAEFKDIFRKEDVKEEWVKSIESDHPNLYALLSGIKLFGNKQGYNYCYCVYMAVRLLEMHRILKDTGSIYYHCDQTMSHYIKLVMDCIFSENNFRNEVAWCYSGGGTPDRDFPRKHDTIFRYSKTDKRVFNVERKPYKENTQSVGKHSTLSGGKNIDLARGTPVTDWWLDIKTVTGWNTERTGYPTQKPLALLGRIIRASSNEGDVILDPFCGCATSCVQAELLQRRWVGIDVSVKAFELVKERISDLFVDNLARTFDLDDIKMRTDIPTRIGMEHDIDSRYVYVMQNDLIDGLKIGYSKNPESRALSVLSQAPVATKVLWKMKTKDYRELEHYLQKSFQMVAGDRSNEWRNTTVKQVKEKVAEYKKSKLL